MIAIEIPIKGGFIVVDPEDAHLVLRHSCYVKNDHSDRVQYVMLNRQGRTLLLHRLIMNALKGIEVDHIDGNGLNCCKDNMRLCSRSDNAKNRRGNKNKKSCSFKGVFWAKDKKRWRAKIKSDNKTYHLGYLDDPREAALAYDHAARELHGEFAVTNFRRPYLAISPRHNPSGTAQRDTASKSLSTTKDLHEDDIQMQGVGSL